MKDIINQIVDIENKAKSHQLDIFSRNMKRLFHEFESMGYKVVNPLGEKYDSRDTSLEANFSNPDGDTITKVLKPTIFRIVDEEYQLVQKGVVIVE